MLPQIVHDGCLRYPPFGGCPLVTDLGRADLSYIEDRDAL